MFSNSPPLGGVLHLESDSPAHSHRRHVVGRFLDRSSQRQRPDQRRGYVNADTHCLSVRGGYSAASFALHDAPGRTLPDQHAAGFLFPDRSHGHHNPGQQSADRAREKTRSLLPRHFSGDFRNRVRCNPCPSARIAQATSCEFYKLACEVEYFAGRLLKRPIESLTKRVFKAK